MNRMSEAIENLERTSEFLGEYANRPENYNSPYAQFLETLSFDMYKQANELKEIQYNYGGYHV